MKILRTSANPKGIPSESSGLVRSAYPGMAISSGSTPTGLRHERAHAGHNPVGVEIFDSTFSQGSSCLATLGFVPKSLWDLEKQLDGFVHQTSFK
jgi:hypothetical protein